ncbi:helix-turn-helix transcriptional regulator [Burkholderia pseudomallei]|nr:helix-turn-helix transcriptional regulator [Burkholderia pseudomallei]
MTMKVDDSTKKLRARFGRWLKEKREEAGLTQLDVAVAINYGYPVFVSQLERGVKQLPEHDLLVWAALLRVDSAEFAKQYMYYCKPFVYEALYGKDPYALEKLPRSGKPAEPKKRAGKPATKRA